VLAGQVSRFSAIHESNPDQALLAYQYLQMLPKLAEGPAAKLFVIPTEFTDAAAGLATQWGGIGLGTPPATKPEGDAKA